jgi:hypothetical protein
MPPSPEPFRPGDLVEQHRSFQWTNCPACGIQAPPEGALATVEALTYDPLLCSLPFLELREFPVPRCGLHGPGWSLDFWRLVRRPRADAFAHLLKVDAPIDVDA